MIGLKSASKILIFLFFINVPTMTFSSQGPPNPLQGGFGRELPGCSYDDGWCMDIPPKLSIGGNINQQ